MLAVNLILRLVSSARPLCLDKLSEEPDYLIQNHAFSYFKCKMCDFNNTGTLCIELGECAILGLAGPDGPWIELPDTIHELISHTVEVVGK